MLALSDRWRGRQALAPSASRIAPALVAALIVALCGTHAHAAAARAVLRLVVDDVDQGEVHVVITDAETWISLEELLAADVPAEAVADGPTSDRAWTTVTALAPDVTSDVDLDTLALRLRVDARLKPRTRVRASTGAPLALERLDAPSFFLNYAPRLVDLWHPQATLEAGASWGTLAATSTAFADLERGALRGTSQATWDFPDAMVQLAAGDVAVGGGPLGTRALFGGLRFGRAFDLDPYFVGRPTFGTAGTALTPSRLETYVNGRLVRTDVVPAGPFELDGLQLNTGGGQVHTVIRDAFGGQHTVSAFSYYASATALAPGVHDYSYAVGAPRREFGKESFSYGDPGVVGRHRLGLLPWFTLGASVEASLSVHSAGTDAVFVLPIGQLDAALAASNDDGAVGAATALGWTFQSPALSLGARAQLQSPSYANLGLRAADDRRLVDGAVFAAVPVFRFLTASAQVSGSVRRDLPAAANIVGGINTELFPGSFLSVTASQSIGAEATGGALSVSLSGSLDRITAAVTTQAGPEDVSVAVDVGQPLPVGTGLGYRVHVGASPQSQVAAQATLEAQASFGRAAVFTSVGPGGPHGTIEAAGGLVYVVGAGWFLTRPLLGSYAVVDVPGVAGVRAFANNQDMGTTDDDGHLLVPNLLAYYGNRLRIADGDLPADRAIEGVERVIAPPRRGGALVTFSAARVQYLRGTIVVPGDGAVAAAQYGEIHVAHDGGTAMSPLGADAGFELSGLPPGTHRGVVDHAGGRCEVTIDVPADATLFTALGPLPCHP